MKHSFLTVCTVFASFCSSVATADASAVQHYDFPLDGFGVDLDAGWIPHSALMADGTALHAWDQNDSHLEIYIVKTKQAKNLRRYIGKQDKEGLTVCNGKPAMTVLSAKWLTVSGHRALMRHEHSCMTEGDLLVTVAADGTRIVEITTNNPNAPKKDTIHLTDAKGKSIGDMQTFAGDVLDDHDSAVHLEVLNAFRFTAKQSK